MMRLLAFATLASLATLAGTCFADTPRRVEKVGGANAPDPSPPPKLVIQTAELAAGKLTVKIPTGTYTAPAGGAPNYAVPGPIVSFKAADGVWRGHGYLETYPRLLKFTGTSGNGKAELTYDFEQGKQYKVTLTAGDDVVLLEETSTLGPRNVWVFDCYYGGDDGVKNAWTPSSGFAVDPAGDKHAFLYLPCFYDKPEATINPGLKLAGVTGGAQGAVVERKADGSTEEQHGNAAVPAKVKPEYADLGAVAVLSPDADKKDLAGFWTRDVASWKNPDAMGIQLWQHRQLPSDPSSRHFIGPDTKSDSTPNPRTAGLMGKSLYEGHVTIELNLGAGSRKLGFAAPGKGETRDTLPDRFKALMKANSK